MKGIVDQKNRALLDVPVSQNPGGESTPVTAWIDTAFDGCLVFSRDLISKLGLESLAESEAILADGSKVVLQTHLCYVDWFGARIPVQVVANDGQLPLLGTGLLEQRVLHLDYRRCELNLD